MSNPDHLETDTLVAHFQAAVAVVANVYHLRVHELRLPGFTGTGHRVSIEPLSAYCARQANSDLNQPYIDYATVLVAGHVGREIGLAEIGRLSDRQLLQRSRQKAAQAALSYNDRESDRAFSIVFAWLQSHDRGDALATFSKIYRRAESLLRETLYRGRLHRVVAKLLETRLLDEDAIEAIILQIE